MPVNDSPQSAPEDLVRVREAALAVGLTPSAVNTWVKRGRLTVQPAPGVRRVSLTAALALVTPPDPYTPADAVAINEAVRLTDVSRKHISTWVKQGRVPSWQSHHGLLVRVANVQAVAQQRGALSSAAAHGVSLPPDACLIHEAARLAGVTTDKVYKWIRRGLLPVWPGSGTGHRVRLANVVALAQRTARALPSSPEREP